MTAPYRLAIAVDLDGVLHSYSSGWHGTTTIADPPVPGALEWLAELVTKARVIIHTARLAFNEASPFHEGTPIPDRVEAIKQWLRSHGLDEDVIDALEWHTGPGKPHASVYIDDRAYRFEGVFPSPEELAKMTPWNQPGGDTPRAAAEETQPTGCVTVDRDSEDFDLLWSSFEVAVREDARSAIVDYEGQRVSVFEAEEKGRGEKMKFTYSVVTP